MFTCFDVKKAHYFPETVRLNIPIFTLYLCFVLARVSSTYPVAKVDLKPKDLRRFSVATKIVFGKRKGLKSLHMLIYSGS